MKRSNDSPTNSLLKELDNNSETKPVASSSQRPMLLLNNDFNDYDVLHGRGSQVNRYKGNIFFRDLVRKRKDEYSNTSNRHMKDLIARQIVAAVSGKGGRFLHKDNSKDPNSAWSAVDNEVAVEKAKQALRDQENKIKASYTKPTPQGISNKQEVAERTDRPQTRTTTTSSTVLSQDSGTHMAISPFGITHSEQGLANRTQSNPELRMAQQTNLNDSLNIPFNYRRTSLRDYGSLLMEAAIEREREVRRRNAQFSLMIQQLQLQAQSESLTDYQNILEANSSNFVSRGLLHSSPFSSINQMITSPFATRLYPNINPTISIPANQQPRELYAAYGDGYPMRDSSTSGETIASNSSFQNNNFLESQIRNYLMHQAQQEGLVHNQSLLANNNAPDILVSMQNERKDDGSGSSSQSSQGKPKANPNASPNT